MNPLRRLLNRINAAAGRAFDRRLDALLASASCAAGCGQPVALAEAHYTILRQVEWERVGEIQPIDGDPLGYVHIGCWPLDTVVIVATVGAPAQARLEPVGDGGAA